jgi:hypothetical protein
MTREKSEDVKAEDVGSFEMKSGKLCALDPAYCRASPHVSVLDLPAKKGRWIAEIDQREEDEKAGGGLRVDQLVAYHEDHRDDWFMGEFEEVDGKVGVDGGVAGLFDCEAVPEEWDEAWPERIYEARGRRQNAAAVDGGAISSSGFGDGLYSLKVTKEGGKVIGAVIDFTDPHWER